MIDHTLAAWDAQRQSERDPRTLTPSAAGTCRRQLAYSLHGVPESDPRPADSNGSALVGTLIHEGYTRAITDQYDPRVRVANLRIVTPEGIYGTADDVDYQQKIVTDLKTIGERSWDWRIARGPDPGWWTQVGLYARGVGADDTWTLRILALNRGDGRTEEWTMPFTPAIAQEDAEALVGLAAQLRETAPENAPRDGHGPDAGYPCAWCPWVRECWGEPAEGYSHVSQHDDGDDDTIAEWASEYAAAARAAADAKEQQTIARQHLLGITGTYGNWKVTWSGGAERSSLDTKAAIDLLADAGIDPPMTTSKTPMRINVTRAV